MGRVKERAINVAPKAGPRFGPPGSTSGGARAPKKDELRPHVHGQTTRRVMRWAASLVAVAAVVTPVYWAISSGFVYRGTQLQGLQGKYIFGDITTGRLFFADFNEMMAADDFDPSTLASIHELTLRYNGQDVSLYDLVAQAYAAKGGHQTIVVLPGYAANVGGAHNGSLAVANQGVDADGNPLYDTNRNESASNPGFTPSYDGGRADIRLALGGDGEIYVLSKSDGMIRMLSGVVTLGSAVPEPASLALLGLGATLLVSRRRSRRA